jgi:Domain of unknown function (DUF4148)
MHTKALPLVFLLAVVATSAFSQTPPEAAPSTRAEVKSATITAEKSGQGVPTGEHSYPPAPATKSTLTRKKLKQETIKERRSGNLTDAGEGNDEPRQPAASGPSASRSAVKAATVKANKAGQLIPAGEDTDERPPHAAKILKPKL